MFSGAISVKINSEVQILAVRFKARWLAEKVGLDKGPAGVLSAIISEIARLIVTQTSSGRIDIFSIRDKSRVGITVLAFLENCIKKEIEEKTFEKQKILKRMDLRTLAAKHIIDEFKVYPGNDKELMMQITKWV
ncbi:MAG: hypothetical protein C4517_03950 [Stygiobacter sp.]|nr:MAG: hypothetical protein C4517_03950 [Stygiobacter sp.]